MELHEALGRNLRRIMFERDISQVELAQRAHVSRTHLSEMANCKHTGSIETLWAIASALGVTLNDLFAGATRVIPCKQGRRAQ